jgi:uncharacterized protein YjbI with pentapeptide repeats
MVVYSGIDIENENLSKGKLYQKLHKELVKYVIERRIKDGKTEEIHKNLSNLKEETLHRVLQEVAFNIFKGNYEYLIGEELKELPSIKEFCKELNIKVGELEKDERTKEILKKLMIAFYFREVEPAEIKNGREINISAFEFYHKSIQEFLTAEYFYAELKKLIEKDLEDKEEIKKTLDIIWELFSHKPISEEIRGYLREIIEEKDLEERKELAERLKKLFPILLEIDFVVKPDELESQKFPLYRPFYTFRNFWIFAKMLTSEISYTEELTSELKERFADFIRYVQSGSKTFISMIPLNGEELKETNLRGVNLFRAKLFGTNTNLSGTIFFGAYLYQADLSEANLSSAELRGANLYGAKLYEASLLGARLFGTKLCRADLSRATLCRANLQGANLEKTDLSETDLRGARLDIESVKKAKNWKYAIYDEEQKKLLGLK